MQQRSLHDFKQENSAELFAFVYNKLGPYLNDAAIEFYDHMSADERASLYLSQDMIRTRLKSSFVNWLQSIVTTRDKFDPDTLLESHHVIGVVHARIDIPMFLVDKGMQIVKDFCFRILLEDKEAPLLVDSIIFINNLLDSSLSLVNDSYFKQTIENERNAQSMRLKLAASDILLECEKAKSSLLGWNNEFIGFIYNPKDDPSLVPHALESDFALWIKHKATLYFPEYTELQEILAILQRIDTRVSERDNSLEGCHKIIDYVQKKVKSIQWLLEQVMDRQDTESSARDPLTKLLNRRYLDSIIKREIALYNRSGEAFGLLMVDIDNFKSINDTYGHSAGDMVLSKLSQCVLESIRATDFCFRYGGEEILLLVNNVDHTMLYQKAEKIRAAVEDMDISLNGETKAITISIGATLYDGHPDYQLSLERADEHLYKAKRNGKNQVQISAVVPEPK